MAMSIFYVQMTSVLCPVLASVADIMLQLFSSWAYDCVKYIIFQLPGFYCVGCCNSV